MKTNCNDRDRAIPLLSKALELESVNTPARMTLMRVLTELSQTEGLRVLLEEEVGKYKESMTQVPLLLALADVMDEDAGKILCYQNRVEAPTPSPRGFPTIETLLRKNERWADLETLYRERLAEESEPNLVALLKWLIVEIQEAHLHDLQRLFLHLFGLRHGPRSTRSSRSGLLRRNLHRGKTMEELAEVYRRLLAQAVNPQRKVQLLMELGLVQDVRLGDAPNKPEQTYGEAWPWTPITSRRVWPCVPCKSVPAKRGTAG